MTRSFANILMEFDISVELHRPSSGTDFLQIEKKTLSKKDTILLTFIDVKDARFDI